MGCGKDAAPWGWNAVALPVFYTALALLRQKSAKLKGTPRSETFQNTITVPKYNIVSKPVYKLTVYIATFIFLYKLIPYMARFTGTWFGISSELISFCILFICLLYAYLWF